ncbi:hypothetical protein [Agrobacterium vitis]|uniref:hypothetical protein n=1 Tax=Agrobacterium vitis TaxID=373 RepID=UPI0012E9838C|nr:hypothetical protein [Agrobacterium vitis]MVA34387.1 hypothetical protein [Agrobacterium vitis]
MANQNSKSTEIPKHICLFCTNHANSGEHIWPQWMHPLIRTKGLNHLNTRGLPIRVVGPVVFSPQINMKMISGAPQTRKMKYVCGECNNGWMSQIEEKAKPILIEILNGNPINLNREQMRVVSDWAMLKTIVLDRDDLSMQSIPQNYRHSFRKNRDFLPNTHIYLAKYKGGDWKVAFRHFAFGIFSWDTSNLTIRLPPNTQISTFAVEKMVLQVRTSIVPDLEIDTSLRPFTSSFVKLYPCSANSIDWPPKQPVTDPMLNIVANQI